VGSVKRLRNWASAPRYISTFRCGHFLQTTWS